MSDIVTACSDMAEYHKKIADLRAAEIERLRAEVERLGRDYNTARDAHDRRVRELDDHCIEVARLRARVAELEEVMREIEYLDRPQVRGLPRRVSIYDKARAALKEGDEQ